MTRTGELILVIDDDDDIRDLLRLLLETEGYRVNLARDGLDAWDQWNTMPRPAIILLDWMMPRMDGEQFLTKIRASRFSDTPVIILSGNAAVQQKAAMLNVQGFLKKPFEFDGLLNTLRLPMHRPCERDVA